MDKPGPSSSFSASSSFLDALSDHPIFTPSITTFSSVDDHEDFTDISFTDLKSSTPSKRNGKKSSTPSSSALPHQQMLIRGNDLILTVDSEVRICSLGEIKSSSSSSTANNLTSKPSYKVLLSHHLTFPIVDIVLNETGKLLACVGTHQLVVLFLPRKGWASNIGWTGGRSSTGGRGIEVKSVPISPFNHSPGSSPISKVLFHPLGTDSLSLLVLTLDGIIREYNPMEQSIEALQTIPILPTSAAASSGKGGGFQAVEQGEDEAVGLCVGKGKGDWSLLSLYIVCGNGDVWGLCPFLPFDSSIPQSHISALSLFTQSKLSLSASHELGPRYALQKLYTDSLMKFVTEDLRLRSAEMEVVESDTLIRISPPPTLGGGKKQVLVQGPCLLQPSPEYDEQDEDDAVCDVFLIEHTSDNSTISSATQPFPNIIGVLRSSGKLTLMLELEKLEPLWVSRSETIESNPVLIVYETIQLCASGLPSSPPASLSLPKMLIDPLYDDVVWVSHEGGVSAVVMKRWIEGLEKALAGSPENATAAETELGKFFGSGISSEVIAVIDSSDSGKFIPITGIAVISDVYLGYSFLAITSALKLVSLELSLRVPVPATSLFITQPTSNKSASYVSLLVADGSSGFEIPKALSDDRAGLPKDPVKLGKTSVNPKQPIELVTVDLLRAMATHVSTLRTSIRDVLSASDQTQFRVDLQIEELDRQIKKIANVSELLKKLSRGEEKIKAKVPQVINRQKLIISRVDKVLQLLMDKHQPELSSYEKEWFNELERMKDDVGLVEDEHQRTRSLGSRTAMLSNQLHILKPELDEISKRDSALAKSIPKVTMGRHQVSTIHQQLAVEAKLLVSLTSKLESLSVRVDVQKS